MQSPVRVTWRGRSPGGALTRTARNDLYVGVFIDNEGAAKRAPQRIAGPSSSTRVNYPGRRVSNATTPGSVGQARAGRRREHVGLAGPRHDVQRAALLRHVAAA